MADNNITSFSTAGGVGYFIGLGSNLGSAGTRHVLQLRPTRWRSICLVISAAVIFFCSETPSPGQSNEIGKSDRAVSSFRDFRHKSLPRGFFISWCGLNDGHIMEVDGQFKMFGAGTEPPVPIHSPSMGPEPNCGSDGQTIFYADELEKQVVGFDIRTQKTRVIANYQGKGMRPPRVAVSPDSNRIVGDVPLRSVSEGKRISTFVVGAPDGGTVSRIIWKNDSSRLFAVLSGRRPKYNESIEVFAIRQDNLGSAALVPLPDGFTFREGVFNRDGRELLVLLAPLSDEFGPGTIFRCKVAEAKCAPIVGLVQSASLSERGVIGTVIALPYLQKHRLEIQMPIATSLVREDFGFKESPLLQVKVAPSGTKAVLTWTTSQTAECRRGSGFALCEAGMMIDLSGSR